MHSFFLFFACVCVCKNSSDLVIRESGADMKARLDGFEMLWVRTLLWVQWKVEVIRSNEKQDRPIPSEGFGVELYLEMKIFYSLYLKLSFIYIYIHILFN